ncbi:Nitric oxide synthase-interacting protein-like protein [Apiospora aurea]|uniref:Nitric oxide synthase-interacting protein-like protein n=1 Tax=Apiospora aurea TaxID=335848 RepID=A0ABR1QWC1_9PEZI
MSHSKRNTSRAVFTSHEREQAKKAWSSTSATLSRESFLPFSSCRLCLEPALDPVACTHGDLFCRECVLSNILAQRKEIKRLDKLREAEARDRDEDTARQEAEEHERAVREFEMTQRGLDVAGRKLGEKKKKPTQDTTTIPDTIPEETRSSNGTTGTKRKFELDDQELSRIASEDRAKARKALEDEKAAKPKLASFWVPSITPTSNTKDTLHEVTKKAKTTPTCPASPEDKPHTYSLHTLVAVHFTEEEEEGNGTAQKAGKSKKMQRVCPSCKKALSNSSRAMLARPCGHVLCRNCVDRFMRPSGHHDPHAEGVDPEGLRCYVCETDLVDRGDEGATKSKKKEKERIKPGLVELRSEGTGFSAGGANQVQKSGVAFQC